MAGTKDHVICPICLKAGTDIYLNPETKTIENISIEDNVLGANGDCQKVIHTFKRRYKGDIIYLKPAYFDGVFITPNHQVLTVECERKKILIEDKPTMQKQTNFIKKWKKARDLLSSNGNKLIFDNVVIPKPKLGIKPTYIDITSFIRENQFGMKTLWLVPKWMREPREVDEELARFMGLYVAEGCGTKKDLCFAFNTNEVEYIDFVRNVASNLGYTSSISLHNKNASATTVRIHSRVLPRAFSFWFGRGAKNKHIPDFIMNAKKNIIEAFIDGYIQGDGYHSERKENGHSIEKRSECSSVSKQLIKQLQILYLKLGIFSYFGIQNIQSSIIDGRKIKGTTAYRLSIYQRMIDKNMFFEDDNFYYIPVKKTSIKPFDGYVYNIETDEQLYCLPFIVHNCFHNQILLKAQKGLAEFRNWDPNSSDFIQIRDYTGGRASGFPKVGELLLHDAIIAGNADYDEVIKRMKEQLLKVLEAFYLEGVVTSAEVRKIVP